MTKKKLYLYIILSIAAGNAWMLWSLRRHTHGTQFTPCFIKNVTGLPCPSCGTTRSVLEIINGNFYTALLINPLGFVIAVLLLVLPLWLMYDFIFAKDTVYRSYLAFEKNARIKPVAIILITLILINWIWNIYKEL